MVIAKEVQKVEFARNISPNLGTRTHHDIKTNRHPASNEEAYHITVPRMTADDIQLPYVSFDQQPGIYNRHCTTRPITLYIEVYRGDGCTHS